MNYLKEDDYVIFASCEKCGKRNSFQKYYCIRKKGGFRLNPPMRCSHCREASDFINLNKDIEIIEGKSYVIDSTKETSSNNNFIKCPQCGSTQINANNKGFSLGKAVGGLALFGGVGLLGGFLGSKKVLVTCLKCGHQWEAGKR